MDVKCGRCGAEYEFEESRISESGVLVRCTNCDHMFKIRKKTILLTESISPTSEDKVVHSIPGDDLPMPTSTPRPMSTPLMKPDLQLQESFFQDPEIKSGPDSWGSDYSNEPDADLGDEWKQTGRGKWIFMGFLSLVVAGIGSWFMISPESLQHVVSIVVDEKKEVPKEALRKVQQAYVKYLMDSNEELLVAKSELKEAIQNVQVAFPEAWALLAQINITQADKYKERLKRIDQQRDRLQTKMNALSPKNNRDIREEAQIEITRLREEMQALQQERDSVFDITGRSMEEARRYIAKIEAIDPTSFLLRRAKANYLRVSGARRAQVESEIKSARTLKPDDHELMFIEGALYLEDPTLHDAAAERLGKALALEPQMLQARYRLADLLLKSNQVDQARAQLDKILVANPSHDQAKILLTALGKGNDQKEEPKQDAAAEEKPEGDRQPQRKTYDDWMTIAEMHLQRGKPKQAIKAYDAALDLKPYDAEALTGKGLGYLDLGENMLAIDWFKKALKVSSRFAVAIIGMAEAYKYHGDRDRALEYYQRYLDVNPAGEEAQIARRNIEELK